MLGTLMELKTAIIEGDDDLARRAATESLAQGSSPLEVLDEAVVPGIEEAGRLWDEGTYFLPDVILSAGAFTAAMEIIEPHFANGESGRSGTVLFGVVQGDMHDLGKNIVIALLRGAGFRVVDLGVDVPVQTFIEQALALKPDIIGLGAYMTTTMLLMKDIIHQLRDSNIGNITKIIVGGAPTSQAFADQIGADAWGKDAIDAVAKAKRLVGLA